MGVVRGGARAQNVTMFNNASWESHVLLPDVDCGVVRDTSVREQGQCSDKNARIIVDMMSRAGIVCCKCKAESMCTPAPVATLVSSLVPLAILNSSNNSELGLVQEHKKKNRLAIHLEQQPFVFAGDVLLSVAHHNQTVVVVTLVMDPCRWQANVLH